MAKMEFFSVQVLKRDLKAHYSWKTNLLFHDQQNKVWVTINSAPRHLNHQTKGKFFEFETNSMEWFWEDVPFSVGLALHPATGQINYYCNIHEPFSVKSNVLSFVDLDLDVVKNARHPEVTIIDQDEFIIHKEKYAYPPEFDSLIPNIALEVQHRLKEHEIFKSDHIIESFRIALACKENYKFSDPSQHFKYVSSYFVSHPWPTELLIPLSLCKITS